MKEAKFYRKLNGAVECHTCERRCRIEEGGCGACGVRRNVKGTLYFTHYGRVVALNVDPIEKKPLYHFYPGSFAFSYAIAGCNFKCIYCQNWEISQDTSAPFEVIPPEELVSLAASNARGVAHTYTEPTVYYEYSADVGVLAREKGLYNVWVTNGFFTEYVLKDAVSWLDAMNIDLKGDDEFYKKYTGVSGFDVVLNNIERVHRYGIHVEVTYLLIPGANDDENSFSEICESISQISENIPLHITRFHPDYKMRDFSFTPLDMLIKFKNTASNFLNFVYVGNVSDWKLNSTFCPSCGELVVRRDMSGVTVFAKDGKCPSCGNPIPLVM